MNSGGYSIENYHDGNTTIAGSLTVSGNVIIGAPEGQSEYLDSGNYDTPTIIGGSAWNSIGIYPGSQVRYAKNGNIIQVYMQLRGNLKASQSVPQLSIRVPSTDLFGVGSTGWSYVSSSFATPNAVYTAYDCAINTSGLGITSILIYYQTTTANVSADVDFFITATYKLIGDDVPATALIAGSGSGQGVQNPLLSNLDGGGFNLLNFGNIQSTTYNGGSVIVTPLTDSIDANLKNITNLSNIYTGSLNCNPALSSVIDIKNDTVYNEKKILQLDAIENLGLEFTVKTGSLVMDATNLFMGSSAIFGCGLVSAENLSATTPAPINILSSVDMKLNSIGECDTLSTASIGSVSGAPINIINNLDMKNNNITGINNVNLSTVNNKVVQYSPSIANLDMGGYNISTASNIATTNLYTSLIQNNTGDLKCNSNLSMETKNITNASTITTNTLNTLTLQRGSNGTINVNNGLDLLGNNILNCYNLNVEVINNHPFVSNPILETVNGNNQIINNLSQLTAATINNTQLNTKNINNLKYVYVEADLPTSLSGIYIICDNIILNGTTKYTVLNDTVLIGAGSRDLCGLAFVNPSPSLTGQFCINSNNKNFSIINIRITNQSSTAELMQVSNIPRDKKFFMRGCYINSCRNQSVLIVNGFDVVHISDCVFELNYTTLNHLLLSAPLTTNIINNTFFKQYIPGSPPPAVGTAPMIRFSGSALFSTINLCGNLISPYGSQTGLLIDSDVSNSTLLISSNIFKADNAITYTGQLINYTESDNFLINSNAGVLSNRALLCATSFSNLAYTTTTAGVYSIINLGANFTASAARHFTPSLSPYTFIYTATRPISIDVNVNLRVDKATAGNNTIRVGLVKNGDITVFTEFELKQQTVEIVTYNVILPIEKNDSFAFGVLTVTGTDAFRAISFNGSLSEL